MICLSATLSDEDAFLRGSSAEVNASLAFDYFFCRMAILPSFILLIDIT